MTIGAGFSQVRAERGMLIEFSPSAMPLVLPFLFNPTTITRTRSVTVKTGGSPGARGGYGFRDRSEASRASQGVTVQSESFSLKILLDATDKMNVVDDPLGIQPEIDVIRTMLEPKSQAPEGVRLMEELGQGDDRAFSRHEVASVLIFKWGKQVLPVFMTQAQIEIKEFLPNLFPYRAEASLSLQVIESRNPIYDVERRRQAVLARSYVNLAGLATEIGKL